MKKFTAGSIIIAVLFLASTQIGCSVHQRKNQIRSYSNEQYHKNYDDNRGQSYEHPRYY